jgi:bifunctional DNA-binding transcriptional regulator/antitoxin component of YhaV-PrlF toxin-antitoxin module
MPEREQPLEEFILVDGSGRIQIPADMLERLRFKERARIEITDGGVRLVPEEHEI